MRKKISPQLRQVMPNMAAMVIEMGKGGKFGSESLPAMLAFDNNGQFSVLKRTGGGCLSPLVKNGRE